MKLKILLACILLIFILVGGMQISDSKKEESITGNVIFKPHTDRTLTGEVQKLSGVSIVLIDNNGQVLDEIVTNEQGEAEIELTVPIDKKYSYTTPEGIMRRGSVTAIAYKERYLPVVIYEVLVRDSTYVEPFYMPPEIPGDRPKATGILGNVHQLDVLSLAEKYTKILIAETPEPNIKLYSKKEDYQYGMYKDFILEVDKIENFFNWKNVTNPTYFPQLILSDLTGDGEKELIVILTHDYGTGVLKEEVHIITPSDLTEIAVDNPLDIIEKEVETKIIEGEKEVLIKVIIDDKITATTRERIWSEGVTFGNRINYDVTDNELTVRVDAQTSPIDFIGELIISYEFKDNKFQMKTIEFELYE